MIRFDHPTAFYTIKYLLVMLTSISLQLKVERGLLQKFYRRFL